MDKLAPPPSHTNMVQNGDFEVCQVSSGSTLNAAFNNVCIPGWFSGNGTPSICNNITVNNNNIQAIEGDNFACLSSTGTDTTCMDNEMIFTSVNLCPGAQYRLGFYDHNIFAGPTIGEGTITVVLRAINTGWFDPIFDPNDDGVLCVEPPLSKRLVIEPVNSLDGWVYVETDFTVNNFSTYMLGFFLTPDNFPLNVFNVGFDSVTVTCLSSPYNPSIDYTTDCNGEYNFTGTTNILAGTVPGVDAWCWDFGDGSTTSGQNATHTYSQSGTYQVCLTIADGSGGCTNQICDTVEYESNPITIEKFYAEDPISGELTFTLIVCNTSDGAVQQITVTDIVSPLLNITSTGNFVLSGNTLSQIIELAANSCDTLMFTAERADMCHCTLIENCASAVIAGDTCRTSSDCIEIPAIIVPVVATMNINYDSIICYAVHASTTNIDTCTEVLWNFGDGTTSSNTSTTHNYSDNGTYTITLIVSNGCESDTITSLIKINCVIEGFTCPCTGTGTLNIDATVTNPFYDAALGGTLYSVLEAAFNYDQDDDGDIDGLEHNNCIAIAGRLIVDRDVKFVTCNDIRMQPCSEISIGTGQPVGVYPTLELRTNNVHGCERMWQGITIQPHCQLIMTKNTFADAQYAVTPIGSNSQQLNQLPTRFYTNINRFERNHIGVFVPTTWNEVVWHAPFVNNQFIGSEINQSLLPPCDALLPNYSNQMGYAGVVTLGTTFEVGTPGVSGLVNSFLDIRNGVIGENNPWVNVYRANFNNLPGYMGAFSQPTFNASSGVGVLLKGGLSSVENSRFYQVGHGLVTTDAFNISALNNQMPDVYTGILAQAPRGFRFNQNQNIDFRDWGIYVRNSAQLPGFASKLQINGNHLHTIEADNDGFMEAGISVGGSTNNGNYEDAQIKNNQITLTDVIEGLSVSIVNNWGIHNNNITIAPHLLNLPHQGTTGISLSHSSLNELYSNVVTDISSNPGDGEIGISVGNAPANTFCDNTTTGVSVGAIFRGPCDNTSLRNLTTNNNSLQHALLCQSGTVISKQPDPLFHPNDNHSNSFFNSSVAFHGGNDVQVANSEFRVKTGAPPDHPSWVVLPGIPGGYDPNNPQWFMVNGNDLNECDPQQPEGPMRRDELLSSTDEYFATGGFIGSPFGDVLNWEGSLRLYKRVKQYGNLVGLSSVVDSFISTASIGPLGGYAAVDHAIAEIHNFPSSLGSDIESALAEIGVAQEQSGDILTGLSIAVTWDDSVAVYRAAEEAKLAGLPAYGDLMEYLRVADSLRNAKATAAWILNEALPTNDLIQVNLKTVNRVYLETVGQGIYTLTNQQFKTVSPIAHQCPLEGGSAVYLARNLHLLKGQGIFNDDLACGFGIQERKQPVIRTKLEEISIQPNPASIQLLISLESVVESTTYIKIVDINGRIVWTDYIPSGSNSLILDVNDFNQGIYICSAASGSKLFDSVKFVVQH